MTSQFDSTQKLEKWKCEEDWDAHRTLEVGEKVLILDPTFNGEGPAPQVEAVTTANNYSSGSITISYKSVDYLYTRNAFNEHKNSEQANK